jgi:hypothetical protein
VLKDKATTEIGRDPDDEGIATPFRAAMEPVVDDRNVCPYLAAEGPDGVDRKPVGWPAPANRCVALGEPQPQSDRQQELVCLTSGHLNCPRYLRGILLAASPPPRATRPPISAAVLGSALVLAASLAASFGFLIVRGGFDLPSAAPGSSQLLAILASSPPPAAVPQPSATASLDATATPTIAPPTASPSPPAATPVPTPRPTPRPTPPPTSDRYAVLVRCPGVSDCWIYTIRSGDNLHSIANWFGVSYSRMLAMNPGLTRPIRAGEKLRIPTPTR